MVGPCLPPWQFFFWRGFFVAYHFEAQGNPNFNQHGIAQTASEVPGKEQAGGNMEGKEVRFGIVNSALFATVTTDASCGAINSWHDSFTPLGGMVPLLNIMLGEIIFGGVGAGMYGMLVMVVLTVFIAGLMVGRTPEYLGKKIEAKDVKMAMLYVLVFALSILGFCAWSSVADYGTANAEQRRTARTFRDCLCLHLGHGQQRLGVCGESKCNTLWYNTTMGLAMLIGRFLHDHSDDGHCRQSGQQESSASLSRHIPCPYAPVRGVAGRRDTDRWRADLFPDPFAGTDCGTFPDERRHDALNQDYRVDQFHEYTTRGQDGREKHRKDRLFDPPIVKRAIKDAFQKLDPR